MTTSTNGKFDRKPFIAGNWKMNMDHVQGITLLQKLAWTLSDAERDYSRVEVAVFPPFTDLRGIQTLVRATNCRRLRRPGPLPVRLRRLHRGDFRTVPRQARLQLRAGRPQ